MFVAPDVLFFIVNALGCFLQSFMGEKLQAVGLVSLGGLSQPQTFSHIIFKKISQYRDVF